MRCVNWLSSIRIHMLTIGPQQHVQLLVRFWLIRLRYWQAKEDSFLFCSLLVSPPSASTSTRTRNVRQLFLLFSLVQYSRLFISHSPCLDHILTRIRTGPIAVTTHLLTLLRSTPPYGIPQGSIQPPLTQHPTLPESHTLLQVTSHQSPVTKYRPPVLRSQGDFRHPV